jgi:transposase
MGIVTIGIDLGKNVCSLAGLDEDGRVVLRKRIQRAKLISFLTTLPPATVAMEACCGAHHIGQHAAAAGHQVRLMSPEYVRPYVKAQKNDDRDAEAIAEAATRPTMRFVPLKSEAQLEVQTLHRSRARLVGARTALINQLRAILLEHGIVVARRKAQLARRLPDILADEGALSPRLRLLLEELRGEWRALDARIAELDREINKSAREDDASRRLMQVPGIGPMTASALVAAIGKAEHLRRGRDLAAWLGLVPKQRTTGGRPKLLGISKRGNIYLRYLLIHGARAVVSRLAQQQTALGSWLRRLLARRHPNVVVVALAAKLARIAYAVLAHGRQFQAA